MASQLQTRSRGTGGRRSYRPMSDINVTPFVDVMLVLLVVFMITAPLLTTGVKIDLPEAQAKAIDDQDNKPLEISLTSEGTIFIGETTVKRAQLVDLLSAITNNDPERRIYIKADTVLNYGNVMDILGDLNKAGFKKIALLTSPKIKRKQ